MPISVSGIAITFNDSTTQTTAATGTVSSVATGNGLSGGTITTSGTLTVACPTFNSVGSYSYVFMTSANSTTAGSNYSAGTGTNQVQAHSGNFDGTRNYNSSLSGTWKWMSGSVNPADGQVYDIMGLACRVS